MTDFFSNIDEKHGVSLPDGDYAIEIVPKTARPFTRRFVDKTGADAFHSGVAFDVRVVEGDHTGSRTNIEFIVDSTYSGVVRDSVAPLKQWALGVEADTSRVSGDVCKLVTALRVASKGRRVVLVLRTEARGGKQFQRIAAVQVTKAAPNGV